MPLAAGMSSLIVHVMAPLEVVVQLQTVLSSTTCPAGTQHAQAFALSCPECLTTKMQCTAN